MSDEVKVPTNNKYMDSKTNTAKKKVENAFDDFKALLGDKTHPDNQTAAYHNNVISILNRLLVAADELDSINPGEGIFGLIVLSLRSNLKLKDENVKLEVKLRDVKIALDKMKKNQR